MAGGELGHPEAASNRAARATPFIFTVEPITLNAVKTGVNIVNLVGLGFLGTVSVRHNLVHGSCPFGPADESLVRHGGLLRLYRAIGEETQ